MQNYEHSHSVSDKQQFVGEFSGQRLNGLAEVIVKNRFSVGDSVELMTPKGNHTFVIESMQNKKGQPIQSGLGDGHVVYLPISNDIDLEYALLMRNFSNGATTLNPLSK